MGRFFLLLAAATVLAATGANAQGEAADTASKPSAGPDTLAAKMSGAYFGFGVGLSAGRIPLFRQWQRSLPATMAALGISDSFGADSADAGRLRYSVSESPDDFNFSLPFSVSIYNIMPKSAISLSLSFFHNSKRFQSVFSLDADSVTRRVNLHETLRFYSLSIEAAYMSAIPPALFSINGTQQTCFAAAIGLSPLNTFARGGGVDTDAPGGDSRMRGLADSVKAARLPDLASNGMALSWRLGISAIKNYGQGGGLDMGLHYGGSYTSLFYSDDERVTVGRIDAGDKRADKPLAFVSHRVEFRVAFLMAKKHEQRVSM